MAALYKLLGKKVVKEVVMQITEKYVLKTIGEKAAKKVLISIAKKVPQKAFKGFLGYAGWALLAKDVFDIAGEATRYTTPFVISVSIFRTLDGLSKEEVSRSA